MDMEALLRDAFWVLIMFALLIHLQSQNFSAKAILNDALRRQILPSIVFLVVLGSIVAVLLLRNDDEASTPAS